MIKIIGSIFILFFMTSCQYYLDFWIPPEKIDLSDRKLHKSKRCKTIHLYDTHYPLCPNQKCRDQWNRRLKYYGANYGNGVLNWEFYLQECRKLKE
jgi:hypothetical protein